MPDLQRKIAVHCAPEDAHYDEYKNKSGGFAAVPLDCTHWKRQHSTPRLPPPFRRT